MASKRPHSGSQLTKNLQFVKKNLPYKSVFFMNVSYFDYLTTICISVNVRSILNVLQL